MEATQEYHQQKSYGNQKLIQIQSKTIKISMIHRSIGSLTYINKQNLLGKASANVISKNLVLTAAHNIYSRNHKEKYTCFKFYLSPSGITQQSYQVQSVYYPKDYQTCSSSQKSKYDYALMKLTKSVSFDNFCQILPTCRQCQQQDLTKWTLSIFGYPFESSLVNYTFHNEEKTKIQLYQYGLTQNQKVQRIDLESGKIIHKISTLSGQNGSSIIRQQSIIGLHIGSLNQSQNFNIGRLITYQVLKNLENWRIQSHGNSFIVNPCSKCIHYLKNEKDEKQAQQDKIVGQAKKFQQAASKLKNELRYDQALKKLNEALKSWKEAGKQKSIQVAQILLQKGDILEREQKNSEAMVAIEECLKIQQEIIGKDSKQAASTCNKLGVMYSKDKNYQKAFQNFQRAQEIIQKQNGKQSIQYAESIHQTGRFYSEQGNYPKAIELYEDSLKIKEKLGGKDCLQVARTQHNIGVVYQNLKENLKAIEYYKKALTIYDKAEIKNNQYAGAQNNLGVAYYNLKDYKLAATFFEESIIVYQKQKNKKQIRESAIRLVKCFKALKEHGRVKTLLLKYKLKQSEV